MSKYVYLAGLLDAKGIISVKGKYIRIASKNREFIERLAEYFGFGTIIRSETQKGKVYLWNVKRRNDLVKMINSVRRYMKNDEKIVLMDSLLSEIR